MLTLQFLFAFFATIGYSLLFNSSRKYILPAAFSGAMGWLIYQSMAVAGSPLVFACFVGAVVAASIGEFFSRHLREVSLTFIIPGVLPLVPGAGMYRTMLGLLHQDFSAAAEAGTQTILMAGSIAVAILIVSSFVRGISTLAHPDRKS